MALPSNPNFHRPIIFLLLFGAGAFFGTSSTSAAPGAFDPTFGGTGAFRTAVGAGRDKAEAIARQPDGKLIVAGSSENVSGNVFSLVRYHADGTLDPTFGVGGKVLLTLIEGGARAVTVLSDGKILAAGYGLFGPGNTCFMLARFNANGTPDTSLDSDGIVLTDVRASHDGANAMAVQADGKIVLAGTSRSSSTSPQELTVVRYFSDGVLDSSFEGDGIAIIAAAAEAFAIAPQGPTKLLVAGTGGGVAMLVRLHSDGSLDTSFDGDGLAPLEVPETLVNTSARAFAFYSPTAGDDRIIVTGERAIVVPLTDGGQIRVWSRSALDGSPDTTFGSAGRVTLAASPASSSTVRVLFQVGIPNGFFIGGMVNYDLALLRLRLDGTLDPAFDSDGIAVADLGASYDLGSAMLIQPDGRVVVAGTSTTIPPPDTFQTSDSDFGVVRFNASGTLDATFSGDGKRLDDVGNGFVAALSTALQADGKIVVAGVNAVARFHPDGSFDATFDGDGKAKIPFGFLSGVAIQPDGRIVVGGSLTAFNGPGSFLAFRFNANGSPDLSFDGDGAAFTTIGSSQVSAAGVGLQSDGGIIIAGDAVVGSGTPANYDFAAVRFLPNGALDNTFGINGRVTTAIGTGFDFGNAMLIQADDKILVAGSAASGSGTDFAVVRYHPDGSLDHSFSFDGKVITPVVSPDFDEANAMALQGGKIIVAGSARVGLTLDFALVRYTQDGALDSSFDGDGKTTTPVGSLDDRCYAVAVQTNGKIVGAGWSETSDTINDFAVVRYGPDGALETGYGNGGATVFGFAVNSGDVSYALAVDAVDRAVVVGGSDGRFGLARLVGDPVLKITSITRRPADGFIVLQGLASPGYATSLRSTPDLITTPFSFLTPILPDAAGSWQFAHGTAGTRRFYRLTIP